jgi:hypothetical protein
MSPSICRQIDYECRAFAQAFAARMDHAAVHLDDGLAVRQPKPEAFSP